MPASSGGKSATAQSVFDAEADDDARVVRCRARPTRRARRPPCGRPSAARGDRYGCPDGLDDEVVGPLQAERPVGQPGDLLGRIGHRQRRRRGQAPGIGRGQPVRPEAELTAGARLPTGRPTTVRRGHDPPSARRRRRGRPRACRRPASRGRRRSSNRRWRSVPGGRGSRPSSRWSRSAPSRPRRPRSVPAAPARRRRAAHAAPSRAPPRRSCR